MHVTSIIHELSWRLLLSIKDRKWKPYWNCIKTMQQKYYKLYKIKNKILIVINIFDLVSV